jgi:hypothetical protein
MARGYKATLEVKCWKEHTCCYCGAPYRYLLTKKQTGHGGTQSDALGAARARAVRSLRGTQELRPCPGCGHYQPEMIGAHRLARHALVFVWAAGMFIGLFVLSILEVLPAPLALWFLVLTAALTWVASTAIGARNPNGNLRTNKARAQRLVEQRQLQALPVEGERDDHVRPVIIETGAGFWFAWGLAALTLALMPGAEMLRMMRGWTWNSGWHPPIVGPGDTARIRFQPELPIESLRGAWRATGTGRIVKVLDAQGPPNANDPLELKVKSRENQWDDQVHDGTGPRVPVQLWADVTFPPNLAGLARRTVEIELTLKVTYPDSDQDKVVDKSRDDVKLPATLHLATPRAGWLYRFFWFVAFLGGGTMFLLAGGYHLLRDRALKNSGQPTRVVALTEEEGEAVVQPAKAPPEAPPEAVVENTAESTDASPPHAD